MYRLIYKSRGTSPINWDTVDSIMLKSLQNNLKDSIGGILLCTKSHFLQVLEGEFDKVNEAFMRIAHDPRHSNVKLISFHEVEKRLFHQWKLRVISIADIDDPAHASLMKKYGSEEGGVQFPVEEWMALSLIHDIRQMENLPERVEQ